MLTRQQYRWLLVVLGLVLGGPLATRAADRLQEWPPEVLQKLLADPDNWKTYWESFAKQRGFPSTYSAEAIEAWVVDEETGQPLEGVIVIANWKLWGGIHPDVIGSLVVMETVTDANGRFFFPAWGPEPRPAGSYLHTDDPLLLLFKRDYAYLAAGNPPTEGVNKNALRRFEGNGKTLKMKKFAGGLEEYAKHLRFLDTDLDFILRHGECLWKQFPRMLVALHLEKMRLKEKGIPHYFLHSSLEERDNSQNKTTRAKCGSIQENLRSYLP
ncbi:MAG: hypothetical protein HYZ72_05880 [Deltaproteobacteria bacterium]|nr:hypothetical protein [Deltaproteobacteria bacterium]